MSEYITEEGKINDANTVKAQADQTPAACSCACIQDLHNYVLTVDFINALQNIRSMINDALINTDLSEIYKKLLLEIRTKLTDVWKHVGLIEDESNTQSAVKQKLLSLPQSELRQGDTRVLTYAKTIEGETSPKQVNDLYVYLGQASGPDAIDEATETSEHISKKWVKILTMEFNDDDSEDINLDDIIRRLKAIEDRIGEATRIVTSIWAYLCKNWWEFVDTADTVEEITSKPNPVLAQNYYCKSDNNIYIYLRTGGTLDEPIMRWVPILNANNIPYSSSVWRHTKVVDKNSWDPTTADAGEFFGQTVYRMGTFNGNGESTDRSNPAYGTIFVWLPTMSNGSEDIGSSAKWIPLTNENTLQQTWRHTKVVPDKPNEGTGSNGAGSFIGETRYSTATENPTQKPTGDVYVWLPTASGEPGTGPHWFNITRTKEINDITKYIPEKLTYNIQADEIIQPNLKWGLHHKRDGSVCTEKEPNHKNGIYKDSIYTIDATIERSGLMVNCYFAYGLRSAIYPSVVNRTTMGGVNFRIGTISDTTYLTGDIDTLNFARISLPPTIFLSKCALRDGIFGYGDYDIYRQFFDITTLSIIAPDGTPMTREQKIKWFAPSLKQVISGVGSRTLYSTVQQWTGNEGLLTTASIDNINPDNINTNNSFYQSILSRLQSKYYNTIEVTSDTHRPVDPETTTLQEGIYAGSGISNCTLTMNPSGLFINSDTDNRVPEGYHNWTMRCFGLSASVSWPGRSVTD